MSFSHPLVNLTFIALAGTAAGAAANAARTLRQRPARALLVTGAPGENVPENSFAPEREANGVGRAVYVRAARASGESDER
jgi:hypothetical protein